MILSTVLYSGNLYISFLVHHKISYIVTWRLKNEIAEREETEIARERFGKHGSATTNRHTAIEEPWKAMFSMPSVERRRGRIPPPASRWRRWKGKSRIWDSKIWSRVSGDSDLRMTALARTSSNCKRQTRPLVRESAPQQQTCNYLTVIKIWP
jgi:hypothetical protein